MTMKENQNGNSFDSISFGSKDRYELNDSRVDANLTGLEAGDTDHSSIIKVTDDSSMDDENGTMVSPKTAGQNGLSHHLCMDNENGTVGSPRKESEDGLSRQLSIWDKDMDSLSSDSSDIDKERRSPEHESLDTLEESGDCSSPFFTDKNVLECDLPDLEVCYKEIDCQDLKDICVDEWRHETDVNVVESCKDGQQPGCLYPRPHDIDHFEADKDSSLDSNSFSADQYGSKDENDGKTLVSQERLDTLEQHGEAENVAAEAGDAYFDATGEADIDSLEDESLVDGGNKLMHIPDQVLSQEAVPESHAVQASYDSKVENGSITTNISSLEGVVVGNAMAEDVEEQSAGTGDVNADNLPDAGVGDSLEKSLTSKEDVEEQSADTGDVHEYSLGHSLICNEDVEKQAADSGDVHEDVNAENLPDDRADDSDEKRIGSSENAHEDSDDVPNSSPSPANDPRITPNHNGRNSGGDAPVVNHDTGETSFSAASMITFSGPIAFSGSLSHRSDGSTTSGKSFAFPVLQSEWNSSPVRMAKADRRHFRKHKGWKSGVLCCRF